VRATLARAALALAALALAAPSAVAAQEAPPAAPSAAPARDEVLVLTRARVVDPVRGARAGLAQVVVRGRVIARVDDAGAAIPAGRAWSTWAGGGCCPGSSTRTRTSPRWPRPGARWRAA
jgi:hypothetical protein